MALYLVTYNTKADVNLGPAAQKEDFDARSPELINLLRDRRFGDVIALQEVPAGGVESLKGKVGDLYHLAHVQHLVLLLAKDRFEAPTKEIEVTTPGNSTVSLIVQAVKSASKRMVTIFDAHVLSPNGAPEESLVQKIKEVTTPEDWVIGGGDFSQVSGVALQALMQQQAGIVMDKTFIPGTENSDHLFARGLTMLCGMATRWQDPMRSGHTPLVTSVSPPIKPYKHTQPAGSFGEKLMDRFWMATPELQELLDRILTAHATTEEGFEEAVKKDFEAALEGWGFELPTGQILAKSLLDNAFTYTKDPKLQPITSGGPWEPLPRTPHPPKEPVETKPQPLLWPENTLPPVSIYTPLNYSPIPEVETKIETPEVVTKVERQTEPETPREEKGFLEQARDVLVGLFMQIPRFFRWLFGIK